MFNLIWMNRISDQNYPWIAGQDGGVHAVQLSGETSEHPIDVSRLQSRWVIIQLYTPLRIGVEVAHVA